MLRFYFFWIIFPFFSLLSQTVEEKVESIPLGERHLIEAFFNILLFKEAGAYVLFGDKPSAFVVYFEAEKESKRMVLEVTSRYGDVLKRIRSENWQLRRGWESWKKYRHLFPCHHWILEERPMPDRQGVEIFLLHKYNFIKTVEENIADFQTVLSPALTGEELLNQYKTKNYSLFNLLHKHHALLGILLGFGKRNSWLFYNRDRCYADPHTHNLTLRHTPSRGFQTLAQERYYYDHHLVPSFAQKRWKCFQLLYPPYFLADPNTSETEQLQKSYLEQRRYIHRAYQRETFLVATLRRLCES
jgi:hypothetical protein